jgi:extracellular elastinolytic metalloproteinase
MQHPTTHALRIGTLATALWAFGGAAVAQSAIGFDHGAGLVLRSDDGRPLTAISNAAPASAVTAYLKGRGRPGADLAAVRTARSARGAHGVTHVRLEQVAEGLTVHGAYAKASVNARGQVLQVIDNLARVTRVRPATIDPAAALRVAMAAVHPGRAVAVGAGTLQGTTTRFDRGTFFHRAPEVTAVAVPMSDGRLARAYLVETWTRFGNLLHHTLVGGDGRVLDIELRTNTDSYHVFARDPGKDAQAVIAGPGGGNAESPIGWLAGAQTTQTIGGNNAVAYLDRDNDDRSDGGGAAAGVDFLASANFSLAPTAGANGEVAVQNLFYLNNRIHDILYRHGFTEAAGNFQADNFGRGGRGGDPVQAQAQDGGGTDNANFATPSDGSAPRMQMYLWTGAGPTHNVQVGGGAGYGAHGAEFGPPLTSTGLTGALAPAAPADGCTTIAAGVAGKVALIDRGTCEFGLKALNAQQAGAIGVVIANNDAARPDDSFTMGLGASGAGVTIPAVMVSKNSGVALKALVAATVTLSKLALQPLQVDAALDSDIVYHEYCHGLTWRMIGRMSGPLAGAIGEGMADACALLINDDNDVVAEYSASDARGIRSAPYTNHPRSYGTIGVAAGSPQVHFDGEIYAAILWRLIQDFGAAGRDTLFAYIVDGMNYTRAKPTYEDMRDGILAAVAASGNTADCARVWNAFAHHGVGVGAAGAVRGQKVVITESFTTSTACTLPRR